MPERKNCLNTVRIIAAMQVVLGHAIPWLGIPISLQGAAGVIFDLLTGVPIFFFLSGYLIWFSVANAQNGRVYFLKRFFRIYPELWCAVAVELLVLLRLYDQYVPVKTLGLFAFTQGTIFQFWTPDCLRQYGNGTPNGALWTITVTVQFYIVAWFLYRLLAKAKKQVWAGCLLVSAVMGVLITQSEPLLPEIVYKLLRNSILPYLWLFVGGGVVGRYAGALIPLLKRWWYVFLALSVLAILTKADVSIIYYGIGRSIFAALGLLGFAYTFPQFNIPLDFSYELYLYHVTFINAMITLGYTQTYAALAAVILLSVAAAIVSKCTVGKLRYRPQKAQCVQIPQTGREP